MALYSNSVNRCRMKATDKNVMRPAKAKAGVTSGAIDASDFMIGSDKAAIKYDERVRRQKKAAKNKRLRQNKSSR